MDAGPKACSAIPGFLGAAAECKARPAQRAIFRPWFASRTLQFANYPRGGRTEKIPGCSGPFNFRNFHDKLVFYSYSGQYPGRTTPAE